MLSNWEGVQISWPGLWAGVTAAGAACVRVRSLTGPGHVFWEQIIVMSWIMELVCVCVLICAGPGGFIMPVSKSV